MAKWVTRQGALGPIVTWQTPGLRVRHKARFTMQRWDKITEKILKEEEDLRKRAAKMATDVSRNEFRSTLSGRPTASSGRLGRASTEGEFADRIQWIAESGTRSGKDTVRFQYEAFEPEYRYWVIQEIGTGRSATAWRIGREGPEQFRRVSVRSQRGRPITARLMWADATGGPFSFPGARRDQQLFERQNPEKFKAVTFAKGKRAEIMTANIIIRREIKAKHYIQAGARVGSYMYAQNVKRIVKNNILRGKT